MKQWNEVSHPILPVLVPKEGCAKFIDRGSGIVGRPWARGTPGRVLEVHYEGNRHHAANIVTFADRVEHAYGRLVTDYPTLATGYFETTDFVQVGQWDPEKFEVTLTSPEAAIVLAEWLGHPGAESRVAVEFLGAELRVSRQLRLVNGVLR